MVRNHEDRTKKITKRDKKATFLGSRCRTVVEVGFKPITVGHWFESFFSFEDTALGPRRIPNLEKPLEGKITVLEGQVFKVDFERKEVYLQTKDNGKVAIGEKLVFRV